MPTALYYGDNLDVLRDSIADESVDLIYLDPPFNSQASYNVLFKGPSGKGADAQIEAFEDTWHWGRGGRARVFRSPRFAAHAGRRIAARAALVSRRDCRAAHSAKQSVRYRMADHASLIRPAIYNPRCRGGIGPRGLPGRDG